MKGFLTFFTAAAVLCFFSGCDDYHGYDGHYTMAFCIIGLNCDQFDANAAKMQRRSKFQLLNKTNPFSLAKTQFAGWTVIIASTYIYMSLCKGDCADAVISKTALVLMGIGTGILTASAIIDKREMQDHRLRHQNRPSQGFFVDILSDDNGISIHRFQNFVWTAIAMIVYVNKVAHVENGCILPELSDTLLALTGISGLTFLTMRATENKPSAEDSPGNSPAPNADNANPGNNT